MSKMAERMARAMCRRRFGTCVCDMPGQTNAAKDCADKVYMAAAALEEMSEPTEAMIERGYAAACEHDNGETVPSVEIAKAVWQAIIDEAMK